MTAATRTAGDEQRIAALQRGNTIRLGRADLRKSIGALPRHDGELAVAGMLDADDLDTVAGSFTIYRLLNAITGNGYSRIRRTLFAADVFTGDRRVRELSVRQRKLIAGLLRREAA